MSDWRPCDSGKFEIHISIRLFASGDVLAGRLGVRSSVLVYEGRVHTLCANGANRPVSGRILDQKAARAGQIRPLPLYFYRFKRSACNELTITAHARDVA